MKSIIRFGLSLFIPTILTFSAVCQVSDTLLTINGEPILTVEFTSLYLKNNKVSNTPISKSDIDAYLDLFINFKLKVQAAKDAKIGTAKSFQQEYNGYIDQLASSYLIDKDELSRLSHEAYQRMKEEVNASHILIRMPENTSGNDTLPYYKKAMEARTRVLSGEPFGKVALNMSNDPSVSKNNGYLGWFSAFQMVYPFESAAFNTPIDSVSLPIRTRFGYHIIKVHDRRPTKGQIKVAHIMVRVQPNATPDVVENAREKIVEIHEKLQNGEDFAKLAKQYSDDKGTAEKGGELPWIRSGQIIPEFEEVAFNLENVGDISKPFQTTFGWHIVKLIDKKLPGSYESMLSEIKNLLSRDSRINLVKEAYIARLKREYRVTEFKDVAFSQLNQLIDSTIYKDQWQIPQVKNNPILLSINDTNYKLSDLLNFIYINQKKAQNISIPSFINNIFDAWIDKTLFDYEKHQLPLKYPEYKQLAKEYYEGMLLFEISNQKIWTQATDSASLYNFFEQNRDRYKWDKRVYLTTYRTNDEKVANKISKMLKRKPGIAPQTIVEKLGKKGVNINYEQNVYLSTSEEVKGFEAWPNGINVKSENDSILIDHIDKVTTNELKELDDCRAEVVSDFQNYLENSWLSELKKKYVVKIDSTKYNQLIHKLTTNKN